MRVWILVSGLAVLVAVVAAACGGGGPSGGGPSGPSAGGPAMVSVSEKEWTISLTQSSVKAGKVTFQVKNTGTIEHNFVVVGQGVEVDAIQPGQSKQVTVDFKPGTYTVICNIPGHEEAGMKATITVSQ